MAVANTLAFYDTATVTALKSFIVQAPGVTFAKLLKKFLQSLFEQEGLNKGRIFCGERGRGSSF
jgi:hypothetical protein